MIIHLWLHWFWITTTYFKGFIFFTTQTISLSCIFPPTLAEAGLLDNATLTPPTPNVNYSSQIGDVKPIITLLPAVRIRGDEGVHLAEKAAPGFTPTSPAGSLANNSTPKVEEALGTTPSTTDHPDSYDDRSLDDFRHPLKKFIKHSHVKYGKIKTKGRSNEEWLGEDRKMQTLKIVEEKVNINISIVGDGVGRLTQEVDISNDSLSKGNTPEASTSDASDSKTIALQTAYNKERNIWNGTSENVKDEPVITENGNERTSTSAPQTHPKHNEEVDIFNNETLVIENKVEETGVRTTVEPFVVRNRVAASTSAQNYVVGRGGLSAGSITGITLGILVVFSLFGAIFFVLYRRRYLNKPQVLHDKCSNLDSSGYIDETSLRENSEEMYSLDNDSFLNSLEAMTIQNYWTENVKHTKL